MMNEDIRNLMVTIEFMRRVCEHAEGKTKKDRELLTRAMSVGIRTNEKYKIFVEDYHKSSFWKDVDAVSDLVGAV